MSQIVIFHKHCLDGSMAAAIAHDALHARHPHTPIELYPATYGDGPPDVTGKHVTVVDFSFPRPALEAMAAKAASLIVLDHHKTAAAELAGLPYAVFDMTRSGAGIVWDHYHPDTPRPIAVTHIEDRDLWKFAHEYTRPFCTCVQQDLEKFDEVEKVHQMRLLMELRENTESYRTVVETGFLLHEHLEGQIRNMCEYVYHVDLLGTPCAVLNAPGLFASEAGNYLVGQYDRPACVWYSDGTEVKLMFRSRDDLPDVSVIAKAFGGGGHRNAAGCRVSPHFLTEIGIQTPASEVQALEEAGLPGIRVWDVKDGEMPPGVAP